MAASETVASIREGFESEASRIAYERDRVIAELEFARFLLAGNPKESKRWDALVTEAEHTVQRALQAGRTSDVGSAVRDAERILQPLQGIAKSFEIICVGHAHLDMNWMWSWPETVSATIDSMTTVLKLMEEFPDFTFSQSQASVYRIIEEHRPDLLAAIRRRVVEGRWEVTASHWVETDKNMVSGEALCRHLLLTRRYMTQLFGLTAEQVPIDWSPDTFGHAATVPMYLARGGVKYLYLHRPGAHEGGRRPELFYWRAPDGSRVLVRNDMWNGYNGTIGPQIARESLIPLCRQTGLTTGMFVYGVGDHGGGPTRRDLIRVAELNSWPIFPTVRFGKAVDFFGKAESVADSLRVIDHELNFEFTGCYTTQTLIKRSNRYAERTLLDTEVASLLSSRLALLPGSAASSTDSATDFRPGYPKGVLLEGWRRTLFSHFHDILPGSGVRDTRTYAHGAYQETVAAAGAANTRALRFIASLVDTVSGVPDGDTAPGEAASELGYDEAVTFGAGAGMGSADGGVSGYAASERSQRTALVLVNLRAEERSGIVEATIWDPGRSRFPDSGERLVFSVVGPDGKPIRAQVIDEGAYWAHNFHRIAFPANVPSFGIARYFVTESIETVDRRGERGGGREYGESESGEFQTGLKNICTYATYERSPEGLENDLVRIELDPVLGGIARAVHKPSGSVFVDQSRTPAALLEYGVERARPMSAWEIEHTGPRTSPELVSLTRDTDGPYVGRIRARYRIMSSEMDVVYELRRDDPMIRVRVHGTWVERGGEQRGTPVLYFRLPLAIDAGVARYEVPFGGIERRTEHGEEVPSLRYASVVAGDRKHAVTVVNDSKHGHSYQNGDLRVTLIRSSYFPDPLPEIGEHDVRFGIVAHDGAAGFDELARIAERLDSSPVVIATDRHAGSVPARAEFITVRGGVVVSAVKQPEEGEGIVLRLTNPTDRRSRPSIRLNPLLGRIVEAFEVDACERDVEQRNVTLRDGVATITVEAGTFTTVRLSVR